MRGTAIQPGFGWTYMNVQRVESTTEFLEQVKVKIDTPEKWFQGAAYEGADPNSSLTEISLREERKTGVPICVGYACRGFSASMALNYDPFDKGYNIMVEELPEEFRSLGRDGWGAFNDHPSTTHADMMAYLDRCIERARKEGV